MKKFFSSLYRKHRSHFLTLAFILGFIVDTITLNRVDELLDNIILFAYIFLAMLSLLFLYASSAEKFPENINGRIRKFAPLVTQYAFGGLFSGILIFYGRSGSWLDSWPFLLIILGAIFGNETIRDRVQRLLFNLGMLFVGLFLYVVLVVPVFLGVMGPVVFVGSGILALLLMLIFLRILKSIVPRFILLHQRPLVFIIGIIFATFNFLYFANIIPPIPLSLKEVGIFHSVVRFEDGSYQLKYETGKWWEFFKDSDTVFHPEVGGSIFCFARVFAPTSIDTDIYHKWEHYDDVNKKWVEYFRVSYPITGGGSEGYRGYTLIENYQDGKWRCTVETARGQVLGREGFTIESAQPPAAFETRRR